MRVTIFISTTVLTIGVLSTALCAAPGGDPMAEVAKQVSPHSGQAVETGVIEGVLKNGNKPLAGAKVMIEVVEMGEVILTLPKTTDEKGAYTFKNIFKTPDFAYSVSTEFEGKVYRAGPVSLKPGESMKRLDLLVGAGQKEAYPVAKSNGRATQEDMDMTGAGQEQFKKQPIGEYKVLAAMGAVGAVVFAFWQRKNSSSKKG